MDFEERLVTSELTGNDNDIEYGLRPRSLDEYVGQEKGKRKPFCLYRSGKNEK